MNDNTYFKKIGKEIFTIPGIDELCDVIKIKLNDLKTQRDYWQGEYEKTKNSIYRDEELVTLKKENKELSERLHNGFGITNEEKEAITNWRTLHIKDSCPNCSLLYSFYPTGIGIVGEVSCIFCKKKFIFRDID